MNYRTSSLLRYISSEIQNKIDRIMEDYRHNALDDIKHEAASADTDQERLHSLAHHSDPEVRANVARNYYSHPKTLGHLFRNGHDEEVLQNDARKEHKKEDPEELYLGTRKQKAEVANKTKSDLTMRDLAKNHLGSYQISGAIASNPHAPEDVLEKIARKHEPTREDKKNWNNLLSPHKEAKDEIRMDIASHRNTNQATLHHLSKDENSDIRELVADNANTHPDTLGHLSKDSHEGTLLNVATNPSSDNKTLRRLSQNTKFPSVSSAARNRSLTQI